MNNTVCDSPFEVTVAKLRGVRDGPYWGASSDAGEFGPVPGVGANCIRPPDDPGRGRMIRRRTGMHTATRLCKGCMVVSHTAARLCKGCMIVSHTATRLCKCCMVVSHTATTLCKGCMAVSHTATRLCKCCMAVSHTAATLCRCCTIISHTATDHARPARPFHTL